MAGLLIDAALPAFLREAAAAPHRYGEWDCLMMLANWAQHLTGADPAADLRGTYRSDFGWKRIVVAHGGFVPLVGSLAERCGARLVMDTSLAGDVAVIDVAGIGEMGGIWTGLGWAMKPNDGLTIAPGLAKARWRLG